MLTTAWMCLDYPVCAAGIFHSCVEFAGENLRTPLALSVLPLRTAPCRSFSQFDLYSQRTHQGSSFGMDVVSLNISEARKSGQAVRSDESQMQGNSALMAGPP